MNDMITVTVYTDTIKSYPMSYRDSVDDNLTDVKVRRGDLLRFFTDVLHRDPADFDNWYENESTADDLDWLYDFTKELDLPFEAPELTKYTVELTSTYELWASSDANAVRQAMAQTTPNDFNVYVDGKLWS